MAQRVKLRRPVFEARAQEQGLATQTEQAQAIGVSDSVHSRALAGHRAPNGQYVLGVLRLLGSEDLRREIDELFETEAGR
jgi:hypothetical protein